MLYIFIQSNRIADFVGQFMSTSSIEMVGIVKVEVGKVTVSGVIKHSDLRVVPKERVQVFKDRLFVKCDR